MPVTNVVTQSHKLDFTSLFEMRKLHQTRQAALGVRTNQDLSSVRPDTTYQQLTRRFHQALREHQDSCASRPAPGAKRNERWQEKDPGKKHSGNSANAEAVATAVANRVCIDLSYYLSYSDGFIFAFRMLLCGGMCMHK